MTVFIGIDVGLTGAIARVGGNLPAVVQDLVAVNDGERRESKKTGRVYQPRRLCGASLLAQLRELCPADEVAMVLFEDIQARPSSGSGDKKRSTTIFSEGSLMQSKGLVQGIMDVSRFAYQVVHPQTWMTLYGISSGKKQALEMARKLYPGLAHDLRLAAHHNRGDAVLLAHWASRKLG